MTPEQLARAEEKLRNPAPGSKIEAARKFGIDLTLVAEQLRRSPAERVRDMHEAAVTLESVRGAARRVPK